MRLFHSHPSRRATGFAATRSRHVRIACATDAGNRGASFPVLSFPAVSFPAETGSVESAGSPDSAAWGCASTESLSVAVVSPDPESACSVSTGSELASVEAAVSGCSAATGAAGSVSLFVPSSTSPSLDPGSPDRSSASPVSGAADRSCEVSSSTSLFLTESLSETPAPVIAWSSTSDSGVLAVDAS